MSRNQDSTRSRFRSQEDFNRQGRWVREFAVRLDIWPIIEHWASEHSFRMVFIKGGRRVYERREVGLGYVHFVEFRVITDRMITTSWFEVGWLPRILSLFRIPSEMPVLPFGFLGIRVRRRGCRDLNALLLRLHQSLLAGTEGFHWADLSFSWLVLFGVSIVSVLATLIFLMRELEWKEGLSNPMLISLGKGVGIVAACAVILGCIQYFLESRWLFSNMLRGALSLFCSLLVIFSLIAVTTHTRKEFVEMRVSHDCLFHFHQMRCERAMIPLSPEDRANLYSGLHGMSTELAVRPKR